MSRRESSILFEKRLFEGELELSLMGGFASGREVYLMAGEVVQRWVQILLPDQAWVVEAVLLDGRD